MGNTAAGRYSQVEKVIVQHLPRGSKHWVSISTATAGDLFDAMTWLKHFPMRVSVWAAASCFCATNCEELKQGLKLMGHRENLPYSLGAANDTDKLKRPPLAASRSNPDDPWAWLKNVSRT